jgi:hypothetical protein
MVTTNISDRFTIKNLISHLYKTRQFTSRKTEQRMKQGKEDSNMHTPGFQPTTGAVIMNSPLIPTFDSVTSTGNI